MSLPTAFWEKAGPTDCLVWHGAQNSKGYGCFFIDGTSRLAHRLAWEDAHGSIPDDLTIDHLCRNRACVNVAHMELVTRTENNLRKHRAVGGTCKHGHSLDSPDALYVRPSGATECKACIRQRRAA